MKIKKEVKTAIFRTGIRIGIGIGTIALFFDIYTLKNNPYALKRELKAKFSIKERELSDIYPSIPKNLSKESLDKIAKICDHSIGDYDEKYLDVLSIDEENTIKAYTELDNVRKIKHRNTTFYDEENDDIAWDIIAKKLYQNGVKQAKGTNDKFLSQKEVAKKVKKLQTLLKRIREDFPEYDVRELACNLEEFSLLRNYESNSNTVASTYSYDIKKIVYNDYYIDDMSKQEIMAIDYHEDFHMFVQGCQDYQERDDLLQAPWGTDIKTKRYPTKGTYDKYYYERFTYRFLEEIYAELYSAEISNNKQGYYYYYDEILKVIQIALGLDDNYKIDSILTDLVYKDPISFISHFPVYDEDKSKGFVNNCKMLKAYDIELNSMDWYKEELKENNLLEKYKKEEVDSLQVLPTSQLSKIFFNNLIVMNEKHANELTPTDNYCMVRLFTKYLNNSLDAMEQENDKEIHLEDTSYNQDINTFFDYLANKYQKDRDKIDEEYYNIYQLDNYSFPSFLGEEKKSFYQKLLFQENNDISDPYDIPLNINSHINENDQNKDKEFLVLEKVNN